MPEDNVPRKGTSNSQNYTCKSFLLGMETSHYFPLLNVSKVQLYQTDALFQYDVIQIGSSLTQIWTGSDCESGPLQNP